MPYTRTNWTDGVTPANQTNMRNLESQYTEATLSNNPDHLAPYVMSGLLASRHNSYASNVLGNTPLRYARLDEASGGTAFDVSGNGQNGATHGSPTQGVASLLTGDPDSCYTFAAASSQYVSFPTTGMPTGNSPWSIVVWFKFAANPASNTVMAALGGTASKAGVSMWIDTAGKLNCDLNSGTGAIVSASAVSTGAAHMAVVTWDGTTLKLYLDGASVGTPTTPGALSLVTTACNLGANTFNSAFWTGQLDEGSFFGAALSAATITALYNAGTTATTQVDMTSGTVYPAQSDGTTRQRAISSASFNTVTPNATYYLYAQPDGTTYWSTANTPAANSLALAQVTTDGSGNVKLVTDVRNLVAKVLPNATGGVSFPAIGGQATAGSFGAPVIVAQALNVSITDTISHTVLSFIPTVTGLYRVSASFCCVNTGTITPLVRFNCTGGNSGVGTGAALSTGNGATYSGPGGGATVASNLDLTCTAAVIYAAAGSPFTCTFQDSTGTPNDHVTFVVERLA